MTNNKEKQLKQAKITPMAYVKSFRGIEFIVKIQKDKEATYAMVSPPDYGVEEERSEGLLMSATTKHDFIPYQGEIYSYQEYREKLKSLQKELLRKEDI